MKMRVIQDAVRLCAFLGCFLAGFVALPAYSASALCDTDISQRIQEGARAKGAGIEDAMHQAVPGPADREAIANPPCMSKKLKEITDGFSSAPADLVSGITGGLFQGDAASLLNNMFQSSFDSINEAVSMLPKMMDFQSLASDALGGLIGKLGGTDTFSSELCGMMVDTVISFVQCQLPMQLPSIGDFSLNLNLPNNCAGNLARDGLFALDQTNALKGIGQPPVLQTNGTITPGTSDLATKP